MEILINPNVGYALLVGGSVLAVLALFIPGTGLMEVAALAALAAAAWAMINNPINIWALVLMGAAIVPLVLAVRSRKSLLLLILAEILLLVGSLFVFATPDGRPAVHPLVGVLVSLLAVGLLWLVARKGLQSTSLTPAHDPDSLVGQVGTAVTDIGAEGSVYIGGENWSALSDEPIGAGSAVRVLSRDGLTLQVEAAAEETQQDQIIPGGNEHG